MVNRVAPRFAVAFAALFLSMCTGDPPATWYEPPPGLTPATGATVNHSVNPRTANAPDGDTQLVTVDGLTIDTPETIVLPSGSHTLELKYNGAASQGTVTLRAVLQPGATYAVKGERDGPCDAMVWLQDAGSGQLIGAKQDTHLTAKVLATGAPPFAVACN